MGRCFPSFSAGSKGGQKGHMPAPPPPPPPPPPPKRPQGIPCPQKKVNFRSYDPKIVTKKKMAPVRVAHSNPIPTRLQSVKMVGH